MPENDMASSFGFRVWGARQCTARSVCAMNHHSLGLGRVARLRSEVLIFQGLGQRLRIYGLGLRAFEETWDKEPMRSLIMYDIGGCFWGQGLGPLPSEEGTTLKCLNTFA